jgi:AcrR family transcriptional regulator
VGKIIKQDQSRHPEREPSKSELTRQRILDAAARVFATQGYAHARLSDVAKEAKAHAGGIYYYFASREVLVSEVLDFSTRQSIAGLEAALDALPTGASARDRLLAAATALLEGIMAQDSFNLAHNRIYAQVPEDLRERHRPLLRRYFSMWRGIIREGQESGEFRADIEPNILRLTIVGSIQWATEWVNASNATAEALAAEMMKVFFSGILVELFDAKR